jgi:hypothetical protein
MKTNFFKWILVIFASFMVNTIYGQSGWSLNGNAGTDPAVNFIGTTDNKTFKIKTNNITRINIISSGKVGIGNFTPVWRFDVQGGSINTDSLYRIKGASVLSATASGIQIGATGAKVGIGTASPVDALQVVGTISATGGNSTNWNSAFSWGNHGTQGYLKGAGLTANRLTLWNGSTLVNSSITETGGSIGIGTTSPATFLHVSTTSLEAMRINGGSSTSFPPAGMFVSFYENGFYRGYIGSYSGAATDMDLGTGSGNTTGSLHLTIQADPKLTIKSNGDVAIGTTTSATGYKLSVAGKVMCEELKVQLQTSWPDYVFAKDYRLKSLEELSAFIDVNGHLPGLPSASEIEGAGGVEVGNIQVKMLEKIEELTLYVIRLNDQLANLKAENAELRRGK